MISWVERQFKVMQCAINIIHSVPKWQLDAGRWKTIERKVCSLESVAPKIIRTIEAKGIKVNYTYAPYCGASLMDFEFTVTKKVTTQRFLDLLVQEVNSGALTGIVSLTENNDGAGKHVNSRFSIDIIKSSIDIRDDKIYFFGYFNNEGSGIWLHELAKYILNKNNEQ
ncbi:MAG: hypothetical protein HZC26_00555 [Candidatus Magasanikbacteria bacterium]|nr:hypothetical protein [Candidatus Magasanikbacteria bacterium]